MGDTMLKRENISDKLADVIGKKIKNYLIDSEYTYNKLQTLFNNTSSKRARSNTSPFYIYQIVLECNNL